MASSVAALSTRPAVIGSEKVSSRWAWRRARMRGGEAVSRSAEASMLRVTIGRVRVRRTSTETAWQVKCTA